MNATNSIGLAALASAPPWVWTALKLTLLLLAVWMVHLGLRRGNPRWRVLLWRGALVWLAVLPALIVVGPRWPVAILPTATAVPSAAPPGGTDPATGNCFPAADAAPALRPSPALALRPAPKRPPAGGAGVWLGLWLTGFAWLLSRAGLGHWQVREL